MANHQMLDNISHQDLKVLTDYHPKYGDNHSYTPVVLQELKHVQAEYPIFLRKNGDTGQFEMVALFGFAEEENLYLDDSGWHAHYVPLTIQRRPFLIGFQRDPQQGTENPVVFVDMDSPRVNESEGQEVFLSQGGQSDYLQHISSVLMAIHQGHHQTPSFIDKLVQYELLETVDLKIGLDNGDKVDIAGLYTIHEENLAALDGEALEDLNKSGYLQSIYLIVASVSNLTKVIELKNQRIKSEAGN